MALYFLYLVVALAGLTLGAEALVRGGVGLAKRIGVSSFFIGLTIVGFGTSTPELATGVMASLNGQSEICIGNAVGSNIFNIAFILGLTALIAPVPVQAGVVRVEVLSALLVSFLPFIFMYTGQGISRIEGVLLLAVLVVVLVFQYRRGSAEEAPVAAQETLDEVVPGPPGHREPWIRGVLFCLAGLVLLTGFSKLLVFSAVEIARWTGMSELVISLTIVSAGTSAPELFTSIVAAVRRQSDISVGNILGSNIFNMLGIIGTAAVVAPQRYNHQVMAMDAPFMLLLSLACLPIMLSAHRISRGEGAFLFTSYLVYLVVLLFFAPAWFTPVEQAS